MTKLEILEVVKQMLADWQAAYDSKDGEKVCEFYCDDGFCYWLLLKIRGDKYYQRKIIIDELFIDYVPELYSKIVFSAWYPLFGSSFNFSSLLPRIKHLQRTIARLEKEIANETITP